MIICDDARTALASWPEKSIQTTITSPPYLGRFQYSTPDEIGCESTIQEHLDALTTVTDLLWQATRDDGTLWLNYGHVWGITSGTTERRRPKPRQPQRRLGRSRQELLLLPARVALAVAVKWTLRAEIIWAANSHQSWPTQNRPPMRSERLYLFAKHPTRYYYRPQHDGYETDVWKITQTLAERKLPHPATMPLKMAAACLLRTSRPGDLVCDPFGGSGTTAVTAAHHGRDFLHIDLSTAHCDTTRQRLHQAEPRLFAA